MGGGAFLSDNSRYRSGNFKLSFSWFPMKTLGSLEVDNIRRLWPRCNPLLLQVPP